MKLSSKAYYVIYLAILASASGLVSPCKPWNGGKPRVFVLSDISNEPDDAQSFVRLLMHADQYDIKGLVATTSYWLNFTTSPHEIERIVRSYGKVVENLQPHGHGQFPSAESLLSMIRSGPTSYGLDAMDNSSDISGGAKLLVDAVDASTKPLYIQMWGGANTLAEALKHIRSTRPPSAILQFCQKLRVYSISDQDNAGAWIRHEFPHIRYIVSIHSWNAYGLAAWAGISGEAFYAFDADGPDSSLVSADWVKAHIQIGPLGASYPDIMFIMEGDSPAILYTMQNGLNAPEHPEWGGWGGRYAPSAHGAAHYADAVDSVVGQSGRAYASNHATIWRWRRAYQNEFAARMQWTLGDAVDGRTSHPPIVVVNGSCGYDPLELLVHADTSVTLDAGQSYDQDTGTADSLYFRWWMYRDVTATQWQVDWEVPQLVIRTTDGERKAIIEIPTADKACKSPAALHNRDELATECQVYHVILEVTGTGVLPLTRYKRIVLKVQSSRTRSVGSSAVHEEL